MRKLLFGLLAIISFCRASAQGVGIGTDKPDSSSILDISSVTQGLLPPRMTQAQILGIPSPAEGLLAYNTDRHKMVYYDGSKWRLVSDDTDIEIKVKDSYGGGVVIYVDSTKIHGIIAATANITFPSPGTYAWGCSGVSVATSTAIGTGQANTNAILAAGCAGTSTAAYLCNTLVSGGFNDWYLPSRDEFAKICGNVSLTAGNYATSSQGPTGSSIYYYQGSPCSFGGLGSKTDLLYVRAVRSF